MMAKQQLYIVDGLDEQGEFLVLEIHRGVLGPLANHLRECARGELSSVVRAIGAVCHKADEVLAGKQTAEEAGIDVFTPDSSTVVKLSAETAKHDLVAP